jgi:GrpB-like predicted nucleotidyltransferase (UPF0157 family)
MGIEIVDYDPRWPALASQAIDELTQALGATLPRIEHMGSTSVPGLAAKPVIDLMAGVEDLPAAGARLGAALPALSYQAADNGMAGRLFFLRERDGRRTHHLHVVPLDSLELRNELLMRDRLRGHPDEAARYGALKRSLAAQPDLDMLAYTRAKTDLIQELVDAARAERGLPSIPVWEE